MGKRSVACAALIWLAAAWAATAEAADSAVVLLYHRFDDDRIPAFNTTSSQLSTQIADLKNGGHVVMSLADVVGAMRNATPLPDKAVVITVDDASASTYSRAWPILKKAGLPMAVAVATDEVDRGGSEIMSWAQLRELAASGVVIASQGAGRLHMAKAGAEAIAADLARARARFEQELGAAPSILVWPYGEASAESMRVAREAGFVAAFGQHSGAAWGKANFFYLPRFAATAAYGEPDRFRLAVRSLPLPALDVSPDDPLLKVNPPAFGFTLAEEVPGIEGLACFASHAGQLRVERLGPRVEVRMDKPFPAGRGRINCTVTTLEGRWRWFGWQILAP
ncbi:chitin deacetylase [Paramagnetospirillum kuznetsovii]|uniref:Chitooligosaccharide deacetylase n=2 Tax=Paramagnetospirillum kuznetsovii TaxID=2053833 RepID=A0A364NXE4_9PROT|nr:chitin deacetylase [Paramagnetospirillum kuznetsovii]